MALVVKNLSASARDIKDLGSIPGLGRSPGIGKGNSLQPFCLVSSMDRGAWWATVYGVTKSQTWLSDKMCAKSLSCVQLCNPMDCSPPGSSVHGILQARILEWVAISFYRGSSQSRDWSQVSCIAGRFFTIFTRHHPLLAWKLFWNIYCIIISR